MDLLASCFLGSEVLGKVLRTQPSAHGTPTRKLL